MADFGEIFGSDDSNDGAVETPAGSPQSEEERSYRSESEARSDQSEAEDNAQHSDASEQHSEAEASGSDDEQRNDSEADQSDHSIEEKSNHSDAASERSRQSDASEDEVEAVSVRSEGVASDNEASEHEEEHSEHERSEQSGGEASGSDAEREGSERPDQSDAEVEGSDRQDQSDVEREASVEREGSDQREVSENEASDNEQEGSVHQDVSDAERSERQEESEVEHSGGEDEEEGGGGDHQSDRHSEYSGRSRGSENEASEREAKSGSESDNEPVQNKKEKQAEESEASHRGSDSDDEDVQPRKRKKGSASDGSQKGSGSDEEFVPRRKRQAIQEDDDDDLELKGSDEEGGQKATTQDLFGEDLGDISSDEEKKEKARAEANEEEENKPDGEEVNLPEVEEEEPQQEEPVPETRIEVEIPRIVTNLGKDVHFVKLPNFLSVETRPYDPQWYEDEIDEDEVLDEEGRARMKLKVENTMRWRYAYDDDGNQKRESNARFVKWSDGSMSLHLGSEIFDVHKQTLMQGDHNHLFIRQGTGLQGQAVFRTKLTFRPHSTDSFTHRKMTLSLADRSQKTQKIRVLPTVGKDPEAHRSEMIKKEEDRLKASIRRESKQKRMREKATTRGLSTSYLEPDRYDDEDDEGAISLSAIKNKYKKGGAALRERPSIYTDSEGSDDENRAKRLEEAKEMDDDDSDLDYFDKKKANEGKKKGMAKIEESDEDD